MFFLHEITGNIFERWIKNKIINSKINNSSKSYEGLDGSLLCLDQLLRHLQQEHERRRIIEDKAKTNVLGITLAFSAILASVTLTSGVAEATKRNLDEGMWIFMALQFVGIVFLLFGGGFALGALRISKIYMWTLETEMTVTTAKERNAEIRWYVQQNSLCSQLKANNLHASYSCIRNGVVVFAVAAMLAQMASVLDGGGVDSLELICRFLSGLCGNVGMTGG